MRNHPPTEIDPALAETVNRLYVRPIDPDRARQDVATIAEAARQADQNRGPAVSAGAASRARRRRMPLWRPVLAAAAALVAIPGGLAAAGVEVPEPFDAPYRAVGVSLPNQDEHARDTQPSRGRSTQAPAVTTPAATTPSAAKPSVTSPSDVARARAKRQKRQERAERARRAQRRSSQGRGDEQRATPATPATPAQPGGKGGGATPATPATPARPQKRSATTPKAKAVPRRTQPRVTGQGKGKGIQRINGQ
jgi:hypothetical protein